MTKQERNRKRNRKLAEWVGFEWLKATDGSYHWFDKDGNIVSPTDEEGNVVWDMNTLFKWAVPKLHGWTLAKHKNEAEYKASVLIVEKFEDRISPTAYGETPALALRLAIEKLI